MTSKKPIIAIIVPVFNESTNLNALFEKVASIVLNLSAYSWEFIFVDDGSSDNSWEVMENIARKDLRFKGVSFSRNFGKEIALSAGIELAAHVDAAIFMDADLQHPPELIVEFIAEWEKGYKVVVGERRSVNHSSTRKIGSNLFYYMMSRFTDLDVQPKTTDFRLIDRDLLTVFRTFGERTRFFRGMVDWMGFKKTYVKFAAPDRIEGESSFGLRRLVDLAVNSLTTFSLFPLRFIGWLGLAITLVSLLIILVMFIGHLLFSQVYTILAYFIVFNTVLFGLALAAIGLLALYVGHIHTEVVRRPLYIVQNRIGFEDERPH